MLNTIFFTGYFNCKDGPATITVTVTQDLGGGLLSPLATSFLDYNFAESRLESNVDLRGTTVPSGNFIVQVRGVLPSDKYASTQFNLRLIKCSEAVITPVIPSTVTFTYDMT